MQNSQNTVFLIISAKLLTIFINKPYNLPPLCKDHPGNFRQRWMRKHTTVSHINKKG